jgi:hypothetical protein
MSKPNTCNGQCLIKVDLGWVIIEDISCEFNCLPVECPVCSTENPLFMLLSSVEGCSGCGIVKYPKHFYEKLVPNTCKGKCLKYIDGKYASFTECEYKCVPVKCLGCEQTLPECIVDIHSGFCYDCFSKRQTGCAEKESRPHTSTFFKQVPEHAEIEEMPGTFEEEEPEEKPDYDKQFAKCKKDRDGKLYTYTGWNLLFGKHKDKSIYSISLIDPEYVIWMTGHKLVNEKKVKLSGDVLDELNKNREMYPMYFKMAQGFLETVCWYCFKKLTPLKASEDWSTKYLHKKCWKVLAVAGN